MIRVEPINSNIYPGVLVENDILKGQKWREKNL